jgi:hypothetical protein
MSGPAAFLEAKRLEIDELYANIADSLSAQLWANSSGRIAKIVADASCPRGNFYFVTKGPSLPADLAPVTAAMVVTVATLGAFEWLRHRKNEIAAAEASGDYRSLVDEFWEWIAQLFRMWRGAPDAITAPAETTRTERAEPRRRR